MTSNETTVLLMTIRLRFHAMEQLLGAAAARRSFGRALLHYPPSGIALRVRSCVRVFVRVASRLVAPFLCVLWLLTIVVCTPSPPLESSRVQESFLGTAKIIKLGKQIVSIEGRLFSSSGKLAATGLHTALLVKTLEIDNNK